MKSKSAWSKLIRNVPPLLMCGVPAPFGPATAAPITPAPSMSMTGEVEALCLVPALIAASGTASDGVPRPRCIGGF